MTSERTLPAPRLMPEPEASRFSLETALLAGLFAIPAHDSVNAKILSCRPERLRAEFRLPLTYESFDR
jgi:hypothetical protein